MVTRKAAHNTSGHVLPLVMYVNQSSKVQWEKVGTSFGKEKRKGQVHFLYGRERHFSKKKKILRSTGMRATADYVSLRQHLNRVLTASISSLTTSKFTVLELGNFTG